MTLVATKTAPAEVQLDEGQDQNTYEGDPIHMNATDTLAQTADIDETLVVVPCEHPGCDQYATGHEVPEFDPDAVMHIHGGPWETSPGRVDCYFDTELGRWHFGAHFDDGSRPATIDELHAFSSACDQAYSTAEELNALEVTC